MGIRGPKPKPKALADLGPRNHHKKASPVKPVILVSDTEDLPRYDVVLNPRELWEHLVMMGIAKSTDRNVFMKYEILQNQIARCAKDLAEPIYDENGPPEYDKKGKLISGGNQIGGGRGMLLFKGTRTERPNPSYRMMMAAIQEAVRIEVELGLTPSSKRRFEILFTSPSGANVGEKDDKREGAVTYGEMRLRNRNRQASEE